MDYATAVQAAMTKRAARLAEQGRQATTPPQDITAYADAAAAEGWSPRGAIETILGIRLGSGEGHPSLVAQVGALAETAKIDGKSQDYLNGMTAVAKLMSGAGVAQITIQLQQKAVAARAQPVGGQPIPVP